MAASMSASSRFQRPRIPHLPQAGERLTAAPRLTPLPLGEEGPIASAMGGDGLVYPRLPNIFSNENNIQPKPNPPAFCGPHPALMSGSRYTPPVEIRSAVWVMLNTLSLAVISLRDRFGIAACTPFLPRHVLTRLSRFLAQAEPALRRCLYLSAAELGALPAPAPARPVPAGTQPANRPAGRAAAPVFRLFETAPAGPAPRHHQRPFAQAPAFAFWIRTKFPTSGNMRLTRTISCRPEHWCAACLRSITHSIIATAISASCAGGCPRPEKS